MLLGYNMPIAVFHKGHETSSLYLKGSGIRLLPNLLL